LLRNGSYGATAGGNGNGSTDFFSRKQRNSYGAYVILIRNLCNGNGETVTAMEWWKPGISWLEDAAAGEP